MPQFEKKLFRICLQYIVDLNFILQVYHSDTSTDTIVLVTIVFISYVKKKRERGHSALCQALCKTLASNTHA